MKKRLFTLLLCALCSFAIVPQITAFAEEEPVVTPQFSIPETGELSAYCGADGNINFYLHVEDGFNDQIVRIVFFEKDTKKEYFYKFDPANYDDSGVWAQRINIPRGNYFVSCRVSNDIAGSAKCKLVTDDGASTMAVGPMLESYVCLVGSYDWIDAKLLELTKELEPTAVPEATEAVVSDEDEVPTQELLEEKPPIVVEVQEEESEVKSSSSAIIVVVAVVVLGCLVAVMFTKKK